MWQIRTRNTANSNDAPVVYPPNTQPIAEMPLTKGDGMNVSSVDAATVLGHLGVNNIPDDAPGRVSLFKSHLGIY